MYLDLVLRKLVRLTLSLHLGLLNIRLPKGLSLASRKYSLIPGAVSCDTDVAGQEEAQDDGSLL